MNAFASYADKAMQPAAKRKAAEAEKPPSALDLKMGEKQRLNKAYRAWQRDHRAAVIEGEPRLRDFHRYLRKVTADQGDELIEQVTVSWLRDSTQDVRIFALRLIDRHANKLARRMGREALDDPMPPETSVYFKARELLHPGGRA